MDKKISELTNYTTPIDTDLVPVVDVTASETKKTTWSNIKATLKTYFDTLYQPLSSVLTATTASFTTALETKLNGIETGATANTKATGSEVNTGTDDTKFLTVKAVNDSNNIPWVAPGTSGNVMTSDGTNWVSQPSNSFSPKYLYATIFENSSAFTTDNVGGTTTFGTNGVAIDTTGGSKRAGLISYVAGNGNVYIGSPFMSFSFNIEAIGTSGYAYFALGQNLNADNTTTKHVGFKVGISGGVATLYGSQSDGTTNSLSSALTTIAVNDQMEVCFKMNGTSSVDYYWRKNGGSWSSATNRNSNIPTTPAGQEFWTTTVSSNTGQIFVRMRSLQYER